MRIKNQISMKLPTEKEPRKASPKKTLEETFSAQLEAQKIEYIPEFKFFHGRQWRADFRIVDFPLLIEIEGGTYGGKQIICSNCNRPVFYITENKKRIPARSPGRHNSSAGFENDCEKYNAAVEMGYFILRFTSSQVKGGVAIAETIKVIGIMRKNGIAKN